MLRIIDRYLLRELVLTVLAVSAVLLLISIGETVIAVLNQVTSGQVPADLLAIMISLRAVGSLNVLLPLAIFLGVLMTYGRLYRDSEMAVLSASGLDVSGTLRPLALVAVPTAILLAVIAFWLAPAAVRLSQQLVDEANRSLLIAGLEPGRFVSLPGRDGVIYVGEMSADGSRFSRMFVESEPMEADGSSQINIVTASSGELFRDTPGGDRFLALSDGFRVEGRPGQDDFRLLRFERNDIRLSENETVDNSESVKRASPTSVLWQSTDPLLTAELHWRLAPVLSVLVLALLAVPMARTSPRQPRYGNLILAVLGYIIYANSLALGRSWMAQGKLSALWGFWWVYLPTLVLAIWLIRRGQRLRQKRSAR
ncbi:MAG TPA: LPS export ABC transporter permease LptF [Dokdonella sp.]|uniref:LPS export ABC transporter permease LptF n=1 Tax=Dokdonella sp. TaxID=2291710 RepID=UPI001B5557A6|nr:LPS export ABC transporter permease LptF [Dokdonella sp.]MBP6326843.1 LPS export ABC transporter permease LptF [Dokdonella sp.]MBP6328405.1 LPS export ABC transporter permease LptF [Dokdonella sp.]HNV09491.1 LPS export ABC transporter permease LptF [Dokdonella sp.]HPW04400.1 LPS export ABC transporter permease LptF [Dokdonella sp.]